MSLSLDSILDQARAHLRTLRNRAKGQATVPLIAEFLWDVYQIGLAVGGDASLLNSPELGTFLSATARDLMDEHAPLAFYPSRLGDEFPPGLEPDEGEQ